MPSSFSFQTCCQKRGKACIRMSTTDVSTPGCFISLVHLFLTSEVLLSLIKALTPTAGGSVCEKKLTFLAHENGHVKSEKTCNSPD